MIIKNIIVAHYVQIFLYVINHFYSVVAPLISRFTNIVICDFVNQSLHAAPQTLKSKSEMISYTDVILLAHKMNRSCAAGFISLEHVLYNGELWRSD